MCYEMRPDNSLVENEKRVALTSVAPRTFCLCCNSDTSASSDLCDRLCIRIIVTIQEELCLTALYSPKIL